MNPNPSPQGTADAGLAPHSTAASNFDLVHKALMGHRIFKARLNHPQLSNQQLEHLTANISSSAATELHAGLLMGEHYTILPHSPAAQLFTQAQAQALPPPPPPATAVVANSVDAEAIQSAGNYLQSMCHAASFDAGWWHDPKGQPIKDTPYCFSNKLALIHSEISEAMEGDRKSLKDDHLPHRDMREVELADALIRIFDLAGAFGMDIGSAIAEKMAYNARRPDHQLNDRAAPGGKAY